MMSEYRNDPPIDFLLDEGSKDYANRYNQHIHAMTAEGLSAKSDIAWELTIRDQRIAELEARMQARIKWCEQLERKADRLEEQQQRLVEAYKEMKAVEPELATHTNRGGYRDSEHRRQHYAAAKEFREALASMEKDGE